MAGRLPSANMSMILTPPARLTDAGRRWRPAATAATGAQRSHNGHCVTLALRAGYNMSHRVGRRGLWHGRCKYNQQRGPKPVPKGEVRTPGIQRKHGFGNCWMRNRTPGHRIIKTTLLHTQASDRTPGLRTRAIFFGAFGERPRCLVRRASRRGGVIERSARRGRGARLWSFRSA